MIDYTNDIIYPVVGRELRRVWGIHILYLFPIKWGAKELLRVSQPSNNSNNLIIDDPCVHGTSVD